MRMKLQQEVLDPLQLFMTSFASIVERNKKTHALAVEVRRREGREKGRGEALPSTSHFYQLTRLLGVILLLPASICQHPLHPSSAPSAFPLRSTCSATWSPGRPTRCSASRPAPPLALALPR
jgi:hypothetical protein